METRSRGGGCQWWRKARSGRKQFTDGHGHGKRTAVSRLLRVAQRSATAAQLQRNCSATAAQRTLSSPFFLSFRATASSVDASSGPIDDDGKDGRALDALPLPLPRDEEEDEEEEEEEEEEEAALAFVVSLILLEGANVVDGAIRGGWGELVN